MFTTHPKTAHSIAIAVAGKTRIGLRIASRFQRTGTGCRLASKHWRRAQARSLCGFPRRINAMPGGFSLLELTVVLLLMLGLLALVWPNLQKPLRRTGLSEAARVLRSAIDDSQYLASLGPEPMLLRLEQGRPEIAANTVSRWLESRDATGVLSPANAPSDETFVSETASGDVPPRRWQLPSGVVIRNLDWHQHRTPPPAQALSDLSEGDLEEPSLAIDPIEVAEAEVSAANFSEPADTLAPSIWWLPFFAQGSPGQPAGTATIELYDATTMESLTIEYWPAAGKVEILP